MHASSILFLSHTEVSRCFVPAGLGEIANAFKLAKLLEGAGYPIQQTVDVYELFGGMEGLYRKLASLNHDLASFGEDILDEIALPEVQEIKRKLLSKGADRLFLLSLSWSLAALFATGIQKSVPTAAKLYVHHHDQRVFPPLYDPAHLLLTESLLATERGMAYGVPLWKMIHLPNHFHFSLREMLSSRKALIARLKGTKQLSQKSIVFGCVSRLTMGKNVEYALDVAKRLVQEGADLFFVLKAIPVDGNPYELSLKEKISELENEKWFFWDKEPSPFSEAIQLYSSFDVGLHLSGAESGSNLIIELMALGIPTLLLNGSTAPSLFSQGTVLVKTKGRKELPPLPYYLPDEQDLYDQCKRVIVDHQYRQEVGRQAKEVAKKRFSQERTLHRFPLILEAMQAYFEGGERAERIKKEVERLYLEDVKVYDS